MASEYIVCQDRHHIYIYTYRQPSTAELRQSIRLLSGECSKSSCVNIVSLDDNRIWAFSQMEYFINRIEDIGGRNESEKKKTQTQTYAVYYTHNSAKSDDY